MLSAVIIFLGCVWAQEPVSPQRLALRQLSEKADAGDAKALYDMARLLETGFDSIPVDSVKSLSLYRLSAEKEFPPAMNYIGFRFYTGDKMPQDIDSALYWIRRAADIGDATAAANLGYLLTESNDIEFNAEEAVKWLTIASKAGVPEAQLKLVDLMKEQWEELPMDSVLYKGEEYYLGRAQIAGVKLLEIASEKGSAKASALLGDAYSKGIGVPYDHQKSTDYFYKAAQSGDPSAQFIIAELLEIFPDAIPGSESPEYWFEKASEAGISDSETAYRKLYSDK